MRRLLIIAHLESGFSTNDPWSPSIDSILAAMLLKKQLGDNQYRIDQAVGVTSTPTDLPMGRRADNDGKWYWMCSVPKYKIDSIFVRDYRKRFNIDQSMLLQRKTKRIELTKNQFKNHSKTFRHVSTEKIEWVVVGDVEEITSLLSGCSQIGGMRGKGMGLVSSWDISETDRKLKRWVPGIRDGADIMYRGFRPCFRDKSNSSVCSLITL